MRSRLSLIAIPLAAVVVFAAQAGGGFQKKLSKNDKVLHALSRLTWGPRPGDVARVRKIGLERWIEQQLHPERIAENPLLAGRLEPLETLRLPTRELIAKYPPRQLLRAASRNKALLPKDPQPRPNTRELLTPEQMRALRETAPEDRRAALLAMRPEMQRAFLAQRAPVAAIAADLVEGKLQRALYSERQLEEVLVDFWFNHFNVYLNKGADRFLTTSYERDAIRPHVLGRFKDIVKATAQHPAMLFYLDNWQSVDPKAMERLSRFARRAPRGNRARRGLNENYARELLELHTMGVDGGYTQQDVIEVARCFTGWTIDQPNLRGEFLFRPMVHDRGEKTVLDHKIAAGGGQQDGLRVIDILAAHPSTARFISTKLAQRFVADQPPSSLVDRMAETFRKSDGDLRAVLRTMIQSKEFFSEGAHRAKLKSPLEWAVSAARALDADVKTALALAQRIDRMGQPLYRKEEPTGYSTQGEEWVNTAGLLGRMNLGLEMAGGKVPGVLVDLSRWRGLDPAAVARAVLQHEAGTRTREAIAKGLEGKPVTPELVAGLVLGSPDFQRR